VYCNCKIIITLAQDLGFKVSFLLMLDTLFECYIGVCVCVCVCVIASYGASGDFSFVDEHRFSCAACRLPLVLLSRDCFRVFLGACF